MKNNAYQPPAQTLRETSALALAQSWSDCSEVTEQLASMGRSEMAMIFKAEVGVFLKGHNLVVFIRREGGLYTLAQKCWPGVFQRLLTAVYAEMLASIRTRLIERIFPAAFASFGKRPKSVRSFKKKYTAWE